MFSLLDYNGILQEFETEELLKEYIETRHAEKEGFDWISEITDDMGRRYGCNWILEIQEI